MASWRIDRRGASRKIELPSQSTVVTADGAIVVALGGVALEVLRGSHQQLGEVRLQVEIPTVRTCATTSTRSSLPCPH